MGRAQASGIALDAHGASLVKGMLARGDRQHDVAAWFGVNGGRIAEFATGATFASVKAAPQAVLPPPGPYLSGRPAHSVVIDLVKAKADLAAVLRKLKSGT